MLMRLFLEEPQQPKTAHLQLWLVVEKSHLIEHSRFLKSWESVLPMSVRLERGK